MIAFLFYGQYSVFSYPSPKLFDVLRSCGAGEGLDAWQSHRDTGTDQFCAYALVGVPGWSTNQAQECYVGYPVGDEYQASFPGLMLQSFLEPIFIDDNFRFSPT
jgi:hypothetical protein